MPSSVVRRHHTRDEKRRIVELSLQAGTSVLEVAKTHGICLTTLVNWRKSYREEPQNITHATCDSNVPHAQFLPVNIVMQKAPQPNRMLLRFEFPCGASAHIESDALDARDLATLLTSVQR